MRLMKHRMIGLLLMLPLPFAAPAMAQTATAATADRIQRQQDQQRRDDIERIRDADPAPYRIETDVPVQPTGDKDGPCRDIDRIVISGQSLLAADQLRDIATRYEGRCLSVGDIEALMGSITARYIAAGYPTSRVYLPAQDLTRGSLLIEIVEGRVTAIEVKPDANSINVKGAFPGLVGRPVNLRDVEQGIDQINRLSSNNAAVDFAPGANPGDTIMVVNNPTRRRLSALLSVDNYSVESSGRTQLSATILGDNLIGLNDLISYTRRQSEPFTSDDVVQSSSDTFFASVPYGYFTLSGGYTMSRYTIQTEPVPATFIELAGKTDTGFVDLDLVAWRGPRSQISANGTLTVKDTKSYVAGALVNVSSRKLAVLDLGAGWSSNAVGDFATANLGLSLGLDALGALNDAGNLPKTAPHAQFAMLHFDGAIYTGKPLGKGRLSASLALAGQYAFDRLYGSEQFSIGGMSSVRGFRETSIAGDHGASLRGDLGWSLPVDTGKGEVMIVRPYLGLDAGYIANVANALPDATLIGGAAGLNIIVGPVSIDGTVARGFHAPSGLDEGTIGLIRLSLHI